MKSFAILTPVLCAAALAVCAKAAETAITGTAAASGTAAAVALPAKPVSAKLKLPDPVAVVEGKQIRAEEVQAAFDAALARAGQTAADVSAADKDRFVHKLVWDMIGQQFVANHAATETKITDDEVNGRYEQLLASMPDKAKFEERLKAKNMTVAQVKEKLRDDMRRDKWLKAQVGTQGALTEADAKKYYSEHPDFFNQPELVRVSHILIGASRDAAPEAVETKKKLAESLAARLQNGDDFAELAKQYSDDASSKARGGDMGYIPREKTVPEFSDAAFALKQDQISAPVRTRFGFHLIKLTDRKAPRKLPFEEVKDTIVARVTQQNQAHLASEIVKKLMKGADVKNNLPDDKGMQESTPAEAAKSPATKASPAPEKK